MTDIAAADGAGPIDGRPHRPSVRARPLWSAGAAVVGGLLAAAPAALAVVVGIWPLALIVLVAGGAAGAAFGRALWARRTWQLDARSLELRHGLIVHRASSIPYTRIQQIDVERGPIERLAGLSQLVVRTAAATTDGTLHGLEPDAATRIRAHLLEVAGIDDAV